MSPPARSPRGLSVAGCLLPWLATMLLIGSAPYLALYMGWVPGTDLLTEAGIDVKSPFGAVLAAAGFALAIGTLVWSLWPRRPRR